MKFLDFTSLFSAEPATLAVFSTFQFDADFFERRLLRSSALAKARRIIVFMDARQWFNLLRQDVPARALNRRYLVVPVLRPHGVFHPKLGLLVSQESGQVLCGSNNLTRCGCCSNLELLNSFRVELEVGSEETIRIAQEAHGFFIRACEDAEEQAGKIAREWLAELPKIAPWLGLPPRSNQKREMMLVHTYEGSLWDRLGDLLDLSPPRKLLVISPYHDLDAEMARRVRKRWPGCQIEFVVQQKTTNLPVSHLKKFRSKIKLSELRNSSRRLHAKLIVWESKQGIGCLVGSANFTTAAFDAFNVETCLLVSNAEPYVKALFDKQFDKRVLSFEDFDPGNEQEPKPLDTEPAPLRLISALLTTNGDLRVAYRNELKSETKSLRLAIRTQGEQRPRAYVSIPNKDEGTVTVVPPEVVLTDAQGTLLCFLVAEIGARREESPPVWIIQEGKLTHEPASDGPSSRKTLVEETGEGLAELLEELGRREGVAGVIEFLRHLSIRFNDGGGQLKGQKKFRLRIRDPFHPDTPPEWLIKYKADVTNLSEAIYEFTDRHERARLRRHAKRGNINGLENFLDILTALVRLLYIYYVRGVVNRYQLIGRLCRYLEIATVGIDTNDDYSEGYLKSVYDNLEGDSSYLQGECDQLNFAGHLRAALMIVQKVRYIPGENVDWGKPPKCAAECLPTIKEKLETAIKALGLKPPSPEEIINALEEYKMFTAAELDNFRKESEL